MADETPTIEHLAEKLAALEAGAQEQADRLLNDLTTKIGVTIASAVEAATNALEARHIAEIEQMHARLEELQRLITDVDAKIAQ